jgi:hypothetical protein
VLSTRNIWFAVTSVSTTNAPIRKEEVPPKLDLLIFQRRFGRQDVFLLWVQNVATMDIQEIYETGTLFRVPAI